MAGEVWRGTVYPSDGMLEVWRGTVYPSDGMLEVWRGVEHPSNDVLEIRIDHGSMASGARRAERSGGQSVRRRDRR
ncbi:hypothetical protein WCLP8_1630002 [uncultured Gammaproteobacteria bacterium]